MSFRFSLQCLISLIIISYVTASPMTLTRSRNNSVLTPTSYNKRVTQTGLPGTINQTQSNDKNGAYNITAQKHTAVSVISSDFIGPKNKVSKERSESYPSVNGHINSRRLRRNTTKKRDIVQNIKGFECALDDQDKISNLTTSNRDERLSEEELAPIRALDLMNISRADNVAHNTEYQRSGFKDVLKWKKKSNKTAGAKSRDPRLLSDFELAFMSSFDSSNSTCKYEEAPLKMNDTVDLASSLRVDFTTNARSSRDNDVESTTNVPVINSLSLNNIFKTHEDITNNSRNELAFVSSLENSMEQIINMKKSSDTKLTVDAPPSAFHGRKLIRHERDAKLMADASPSALEVREDNNNNNSDVKLMVGDHLSALNESDLSQKDQDTKRSIDYRHVPGLGYYKLHEEAQTWNDARKTCLAEEAHLAVISSLEEAEAVGHIQENTVVFVGLHDFFTTKEYVTIHDEPLDTCGYVAWGPGQPNDNKEHCLALDADLTYHDYSCDDQLYFVCEKPFSSTSRSKSSNKGAGDLPTNGVMVDGYTLFPGIGLYKLHVEVKDWPSAWAACHVEGGHLAVITSQKEADAIKTLFYYRATSFSDAFLGVHDLFAHQDFTTIFDVPVNVTQSNYSSPALPRDGRCLTIHRGGHYYTTAWPCNNSLPYVCQIPLK